MESPSPTKIKTIQAKEVAARPPTRQRNFRICSLPVRIACEILLVVLIFLPIIAFFTSWPSLSEYIHKKVTAKARLAPNSDGLDSWLNPPVKTVRTYRLFNVTNYMDIMINKGDTLTFQEAIPLKYRLFVKKNNVKWLEDNKKIQYSLERLFMREGTFDEQALNQEGAFVDILRAMARPSFGRTATPAFYSLAGYNAFNYSKAVEKLEGYTSSIFSSVAEKMIGPNKDKYGFIYRYNGSNGFNYTIQSGIDNSSVKGQMINFASEYSKFTTTADQWNMDIFDGVTFPAVGDPPNRKVINVFQPDFCRPVQLRYHKTISAFGFKRVHEYVLKLVDYETCPEMDENCPESDRLDITRCLSAELPPNTVIITKPHMYGHNSSSLNVDFKPDYNKHESKIYFEAQTGTPVRANSRIQMNINATIDRVKVTDDGELVPASTRIHYRFLPILWIDQAIELNPATETTLRRVLLFQEKGYNAHRSLKMTHIVVGLIFTIGAIVLLELFLWNRRHRKLEQESKSEEMRDNVVPRRGTGENAIE